MKLPYRYSLQLYTVGGVVLQQRGRENLRRMTRDHFAVVVDHDGKRYIYQKIKEHDKNHRENDMSYNSNGRIYEVEGQYQKIRKSTHNQTKLRNVDVKPQVLLTFINKTLFQIFLKPK